MKKNKFSNTEVKFNFNNIIFYIMHSFVHWLIIKRPHVNVGKFKEGDLVRYNWKAKYYINSVYKEQNILPIKRITSVEDPDPNQLCHYIQIDSKTKDYADSFWLRKLYWYEIIKIKELPYRFKYWLAMHHWKELLHKSTIYNIKERSSTSQMTYRYCRYCYNFCKNKAYKRKTAK